MSELPTWVPGHIGYGVVPWKRQRGYATTALELLLEGIKPLGLQWVHLTTAPDNLPSQKVIQNCDGYLVEARVKDPVWGGGDEMLWRIELS